MSNITASQLGLPSISSPEDGYCWVQPIEIERQMEDLPSQPAPAAAPRRSTLYLAQPVLMPGWANCSIWVTERVLPALLFQCWCDEVLGLPSVQHHQVELVNA
jgi:hypothetical protein